MIIVTRRDFCALAALGAFSLIDRSRSPRAPRLRIGVLASSSATDARVRGALDGITIGADEASRTAMLFRADFDLHQVTVSDRIDPATAATSLIQQGAQVLVTTLDGEPALVVERLAADHGRFVVHLVAPPPGDAGDSRSDSRAIHIAPAPTARAEAVLRALHDADASPSAGAPVVLTGSDALIALAREIDARVAAEAGRSPLLVSGVSPAAMPTGAGGMLVVATDDLPTAAALFEAHPPPPPEAPDTGRPFVDLFGVTERLSLETVPRNLIRADAWLPGLRRFGAAQLNDRFRARYGRRAEMRGPAWVGWFAMKALVETALRARAEDGDSLRRALLAARFDGHKGGALSFSPDGVLVHPLYVTGISHS